MRSIVHSIIQWIKKKKKTPQEGIKMLPFKANYGYALRMLLSLKQAKKSSKIAKKKELKS